MRALAYVADSRGKVRIPLRSSEDEPKTKDVKRLWRLPMEASMFHGKSLIGAKLTFLQ